MEMHQVFLQHLHVVLDRLQQTNCFDRWMRLEFQDSMEILVTHSVVWVHSGWVAVVCQLVDLVGRRIRRLLSIVAVVVLGIPPGRHFRLL